jgi:ribonuclease Z
MPAVCGASGIRTFDRFSEAAMDDPLTSSARAPARYAVGRRAMLAGIAAYAAVPRGAMAQAGPAPRQPTLPPIRVTLLGTGSPELRMNRFGAATLVQAGGLNLVFDAGRGCALRLQQAGLPLGQVNRVFLTHFHSDHLNGFQDLWATSLIRAPYAGRTRPLVVQGPKGTAAIMQGMAQAMAPDIATRIADEHIDPAVTPLLTQEFDHDGVVFEQDGVRVIAFAVDHGPLIHPAYGYRIEHAGHAVLLSGDTRPSANLEAHARDLDLLVHEVCMLSPGMEDDPRAAAIMAHHTTPAQAGQIFARVKPRMAVFSHVGQIAWPGFAPVTPAMILAATRTTYDGPVLVGLDLMRFDIDRQVGVTNPPA